MIKVYYLAYFMLTGRVTVVELPADVSKTMEADLLAAMTELTNLRNENEGVVEKFTSGVSTGK